MDVLQILEDHKNIVDSAVDRYLFEDKLNNDLAAAMIHAVHGGKRYRGVLLLLIGKMCNENIALVSRLEAAAAAIEFIHAFSLIQDDLPCMDDDQFRRGKLTCHRQFNESTAILAADALFARAFELLARQGSCKALGLLANSCGFNGLSSGQFIDLNLKNKDNVDLSLLDFVTHYKTGVLISATCGIAAILAGVEEKRIQSAMRYGKNLGHLFQLTDDILDQTGKFTDLGKNVSKDKMKGKVTYVTLYGVETTYALAQQACEQACDSLVDFSGEIPETLRYLARLILNRKR